MALEVVPIGAEDAARVASFIARAHVDRKREASHWLATLTPSWAENGPNRGFMMLDGDEVVGAYLAYYATRDLGAGSESYCNLGVWCVKPELRWQAVRLLKAIIAQEGYVYTDLTPLPGVVEIEKRLGFKPLPGTEATAAPALPWLAPSRRHKVTGDLDAIEAIVVGPDRQIFADHRDAPGVRHLLVRSQDRYGYLILRRQWKRRLPIATVLHASHPEVIREGFRPLMRHLLFRCRVVGMIAERRILADLPGPTLKLKRPGTKMLLGPPGAAAELDYLYSELVCEPPSPRFEVE